eukprot:TRINITY_DN13942_c0_g1_i1.p1 TRINITY_DN13942_c0_g1~~TRINITY_DN13942_c0_g1_i1.p1  ORF type:complete len:127 (+),score=4.77 TRINITY_DN13942_c0_g1_i1:34-414(+)
MRRATQILLNMAGPVQCTIETKLSEKFSPISLQVINESHMHSVPKNSETHFKVIVVSEAFEGVKLVQRHRMVNDLLTDELAGPVHALSISAKTPAQVASNPTTTSYSPSPSCRGGDGVAKQKATSS